MEYFKIQELKDSPTDARFQAPPLHRLRPIGFEVTRRHDKQVPGIRKTKQEMLWPRQYLLKDSLCNHVGRFYPFYSHCACGKGVTGLQRIV